MRHNLSELRSRQHLVERDDGQKLQSIREGIPVWGSSERWARRFPSRESAVRFCELQHIDGAARPIDWSKE